MRQAARRKRDGFFAALAAGPQVAGSQLIGPHSMGPQLMGIVNATPDSFSDGGRFLAAEAALAEARRHVAGGATIVDLGAESTRPGHAPVAEADELARLRPVLAAIVPELDVPVSIDTTKAAVARAGVGSRRGARQRPVGIAGRPEDGPTSSPRPRPASC